MTYEQQQLNYRAQQERYEALSEKDRKYFDNILAVNIGQCRVTFADMLRFGKLYDNNLINGFNAILKLGFRLGCNAARRERKAKEASA